MLNRKYLFLNILSVIFLVSSCANPPSKDYSAAYGIIDGAELNCKINLPEKTCACMTESYKSDVRSGKEIAQVMSSENSKETYIRCAASTGYARTLMNNFSLSCYAGGPDKLGSIDLEKRNIDTLKKMFPENVKKCECAQSEINKLNPEVYVRDSVLAYSDYEKEVNCRKKNNGKKCNLNKNVYSIDKISEKCGL